MLNQILSASMGADTVTPSNVEAISMEAIESNIEFGCESAVEVANVDNALAVAQNTADTLGSLITGLESAQEQGGLDASAAALMTLAVDSAMAPFGGYVAQPLPGLEDFESESGRATATNYGCEAIKETLQKVWKAIMDMISRAYQAVMKFFDENISGVGRLKKSMESFAEQAAKAEGTADKKEVKVKFAHYVMVDGKMPSNLVADLQAVAKQVKDYAFSKAAVAAGDELTKLLQEGADKTSPTESRLNEWVKLTFTKGVGDYQSSMVKAFDLKEYTGNTKAIKNAIGDAKGHTVELGGGAATIVLKEASEKSTPVMDVVVQEASDKDGANEASPLSADEAKKVADAVVELCNAILDTKSESRAGEKLKKGVEKAGNEIAKKASAEVKGDERRALDSLTNSLKNIAINQKNLDKGIISFATKYAQASASYAVASVKNLKKKD